MTAWGWHRDNKKADPGIPSSVGMFAGPVGRLQIRKIKKGCARYCTGCANGKSAKGELVVKFARRRIMRKKHREKVVTNEFRGKGIRILREKTKKKHGGRKTGSRATKANVEPKKPRLTRTKRLGVKTLLE